MKIQISPKYGILGLCLTQAVAAAPVGHYQQDFEDLAVRSHSTRTGNNFRSVWYGRDEPRRRSNALDQVLSIIKRVNDAINLDGKRGQVSEDFSNDIDEREGFIPVYYRKRPGAKQQEGLPPRSFGDDNQSSTSHKAIKRAPPFIGTKNGIIGSVIVGLAGGGYGIYRLFKYVGEQNRKQLERKSQVPRC